MLKLLVFIFSLFLFGACSTDNYSVESHVGLYKIVSSQCEVEAGEFNPCDYTLFFEIVKGQFIGVEDNELGYVFWSGDPKINPELQYSSHLIRDHKSKKITKNRYSLSEEDGLTEYLLFSENKLTGYTVSYPSHGKHKSRTISYKFKPVQRGNLPEFRLNYPGNK